VCVWGGGHACKLKIGCKRTCSHLIAVQTVCAHCHPRPQISILDVSPKHVVQRSPVTVAAADTPATINTPGGDGPSDASGASAHKGDDATRFTKPMPAADVYPNECHKWVDRGGCVRQHNWMKDNCALSCWKREKADFEKKLLAKGDDSDAVALCDRFPCPHIPHLPPRASHTHTHTHTDVQHCTHSRGANTSAHIIISLTLACTPVEPRACSTRAPLKASRARSPRLKRRKIARNRPGRGSKLRKI
jgi:hypothetical protein